MEMKFYLILLGKTTDKKGVNAVSTLNLQFIVYSSSIVHNNVEKMYKMLRNYEKVHIRLRKYAKC